MNIELKPEESAALGLVAQFSKVEGAESDLDKIVEGLQTPAKNVGRILLGKNGSFTQPEQDAAAAYQRWNEANQRIGSRRAKQSHPSAG